MHIDGFSREPSSLAQSTKRSAAKIVAECVRADGAHPHVPNAKPPVVLLGDPNATLRRANAMADVARDPKGRKLRADKHILAGVVQSYPLTWEQINVNADERKQLDAWLHATVKFNTATFGEQCVDSIVLHQDEEHPHLHTFLLPPSPGEEPSPLRAASTRKSKALPKDTPKAQRVSVERTAYIIEARRLQELYYQQVSKHFGHARLGPKRARLSRGQWLHHKAMLKAYADAEAQAKATDARARERAQAMLDSAKQQLAAAEEKITAAKNVLFAAKIDARSIKGQARSELAHACEHRLELERVALEQREYEERFNDETSKLAAALDRLSPSMRQAIADLLSTAKRVLRFESPPKVPPPPKLPVQPQLEDDDSPGFGG